jgi:hypothetical protein
LSVAQVLLARLGGVVLVLAGAAVFWRGKARTAPVELPAVEPEEPRSWPSTCTTSRPGARRHGRVATRKPPSRAPHRN